MSKLREALKIFFTDALKKKNPDKFVGGTRNNNGGTLYSNGEGTKSRPGFRADQGMWLEGGHYDIEVQDNREPHGPAYARANVDLNADTGEEVVRRLEEDARRRGNLPKELREDEDDEEDEERDEEKDEVEGDKKL